MIRSKTFRLRALTALVPVLSITLLTSFLINRAFVEASEATEWVFHTGKALSKIQGINEDVLGAAANLRAYTLSPERERGQLQAYRLDTTHALEGLKTLETEVTDDPVQVQRLQDMSRLFHRWDDNAQGQISAVAHNSSRDELAQWVDRGASLVGRIMDIGQTFEDLERSMLSTKLDRYHQSVRLARGIAWVLPSAAVLLLIGFILVFVLELEKRIKQVQLAAESFSSGNLATRVDIPPSEDGAAVALGQSFNAMAARIEQNHQHMLDRNDQLLEASSRDALTGLYNRRHLEKVLDSLQFESDQWSVIFVDIDHFKKINDTHGHDMGDQALRRMAQLIARFIRSTDTPFRFGGEEFLILLPKVDLSHARKRAEELQEAAKSVAVQIGERSAGPITLSIGIASFPLHGSDASAVIEQADKALYQAKQRGRDRVVVAETRVGLSK